MAKKKKMIPIDCIPKHSQQPRSSPPKRRTDFSIFFNPDSSPDSSSGTHGLSNSAASSLQETKMKFKQFHEGALVQCSNSEDHKSLCSSEFSDAPVMEVDSAVQGESLSAANNRNASNDKLDFVKMSQSISNGSPVNDGNSPAVTPGSVVWARTSSQMWWPAQVMEERSTLSDPACDGHVLVQFYGNQSSHSAWLDAMTDISSFEDSFEERSTNPSKDFKKALKQAIQRKEELSSCRSFSSDRYSNRNKQNHSSDKRTSCSSSATTDDFQERRRGKRERKRKVHFDEETYKPKSEKKSRRLKIMRYLGLIAPVGSPF